MHNIHIKDAIDAYQKINRLNTPEYARSFDLAMVNFTVKKINGEINRKILQLTKREYESYIMILENSSD
jgi:hypothetical protein